MLHLYGRGIVWVDGIHGGGDESIIRHDHMIGIQIVFSPIWISIIDSQVEYMIEFQIGETTISLIFTSGIIFVWANYKKNESTVLCKAQVDDR